MPQINKYVPVLKSKAGEFAALSNLSDPIKNKLTPMVDVVRVEWDYPNDKPKKTLASHLDYIANQIAQSWGNNHQIIVDLFDIDLRKRINGSIHPIIYIFQKLRKMNVQAIPVTGLDRDEDYNNAISDIVKLDKRGVFIRIQKDELDDIDELTDELTELIDIISLPLNKIHILFDLRSIKNSSVANSQEFVLKSINEFPNIDAWQTITLLASGMPQSLSEFFKTGQSGEIPRKEFIVWKNITESKKSKRRPYFGDYGITHPDLLDYDPRAIAKNLSPSIRYTLDKSFLIIRGLLFRKHPAGYRQYHLLSQNFVASSNYLGESFSWGDKYIKECADYKVRSGGLKEWVAINTNHHLTFVAEQISSFSAV